jgi:hypothetical protein
MTVSDAQLLEWNQQGLIPGPTETEESFLARVTYCLNLRSQLAAQLSDQLPFIKQEQSTEKIFSSVFVTTRALYDIAPSWIPLFFSNYRLYPWHGGCAWIFQQNEQSPTAAFLQLRRPFATADRYIGLYTRDELIAHELCHVGRMCFEEPRFEEILAYRSSPSRWRRWLGAIAQSSWETTAFFLLLCFILVLDLYALSSPALMSNLSWLKIAPLALVLMGLWRLFKRHNQFNSCLDNLKNCLQDSGKADAVIYRLTDSEILSFAKMPSNAIRTAFDEKKGSSLRWRLIYLAYS